MAVFCDFENVALGVRDAKIDRFDIRPVLERLLLKGSIVVKKAYCDWERYKTFKSSMHEASFELIEIPHVRQSGKNSADIRLVVDALDLCYTKSHVDTFVIVSGDSDFSPLVSKLRENAKKVIGVGVKNSTSDLLVANCDEFIFYDDLVREMARASAKRESGAHAKREGGAAGDERQHKPDSDDRKSKAVALAVETLDALVLERGESGKIWASVLKSAIKRRRPDFNETRYGFRAFGNLLDEAQARGLLEVGRDEKSGAYVSRTSQPAVAAAEVPAVAALPSAEAQPMRNEEPRGRGKGRGKGRRGGREAVATDEIREAAPHAGAAQTQGHAESDNAHAGQTALPFVDSPLAAAPVEPQAADATYAGEQAQDVAPTPAAPRRARKTAPRKKPAAQPASDAPPVQAAEEAPAAKKTASRARRTRTKAAASES